MRGHDDLANRGFLHAPHQLEEFHLARWRQRRLRFVEDEDALPLAALFKESQKAFAMRMREEIRRSVFRALAHFIEIARDRKEAFRPEKPTIGDFRQPTRTQCL